MVSTRPAGEPAPQVTAFHQESVGWATPSVPEDPRVEVEVQPGLTFCATERVAAAPAAGTEWRASVCLDRVTVVAPTRALADVVASAMASWRTVSLDRVEVDVPAHWADLAGTRGAAASTSVGSPRAGARTTTGRFGAAHPAPRLRDAVRGRTCPSFYGA